MLRFAIVPLLLIAPLSIRSQTARLTRLSGTVRDASGLPAANAHVVVFPSNFGEWIANGMSMRMMRSLRTGATGTFDLSGLPAGSYLVAVVADDAAPGWPDRRMVESIARTALPVALEQGRILSVQLELKK